MKKAFSLIELLISLIIISVIAASFAPIIAKKVNNGKIGVSANKVKTDCPVDPYGQNCKICDSSKCLLRICTTKCAGNQYHDANCNCQPCTNHGTQCKTCTENACTSSYCTNYCSGGQYNDANCNCQSCAAKHGSKCKTCTESACTSSYCTNTCAGNQYRNENDCSCVDCTAFGENCISCNNTQCLKTEADAACPENCSECDQYGRCTACKSSNDKVVNGLCLTPNTVMNQSDCDKITNYNSIYIPDDVNNPNAGGFCVHRKNAGDYDGPSTNSPYITTSGISSNLADSCYTNLCCFLGGEGRQDIQQQCTVATSDSGCTGGTARNDTDELKHVTGTGEADYGARYRTVCNWDAAAYICARYSVGLTNAGDWNLPTKTQLNAIKAAIEAGPATNTSISSTYKLAIQKFSGSNGLQLCAHGGSPSKTGSPKCNTRNSVCPFGGPTVGTKEAARASYVWGMNDGINNCGGGGSCTTKVCSLWSGDCDFSCDKQPCCGKAWETSDFVHVRMSCSLSCSSAKIGYNYTNSKTRICLAYTDGPSTVPVMNLTGNDSNKTTDVAISDVAGSAAQKSTASVRCVVSKYYTDK